MCHYIVLHDYADLQLPVCRVNRALHFYVWKQRPGCLVILYFLVVYIPDIVMDLTNVSYCDSDPDVSHLIG